jgi:hopanoid biosynthesis associated RND transporter like protein HpnN
MMKLAPSVFFNRFICWWGGIIIRFPLLFLLMVFILTGISLNYTIDHLGVNTNTSQMLSPDLPFQKNRKLIETEFPKDAGVIILVVEAPTPEETSQTATLLEQKLAAQTDHFASVYIPNDNAFFRRQALLYLDLDELTELTQKLTEAQPFIGYLAQHYNLEGLFYIINEALTQKNEKLPMDLNPLLSAINNTLTSQLEGHPLRMSWQSLLAAEKLNSKTGRTIVIARPVMKFDEIMPAAHALAVTRQTVNQIMLNNPSVSIRITGETALEHEELESVTEGATIAGVFSLLLVCSSLWIGLRSFRLLLSTFITLILGLILTAGFATISVGHLNLISIAFAVLYIGLGVDYAIHICLHYRECRVQGMNNHDAIKDSIQNVGFSLFLCALTTCIGFLAFVPTDYSGVSELGIISSGGMFIGLLMSLTVLPALLSLFSFDHLKPIKTVVSLNTFNQIPFNHNKRIKFYSLFFALVSSILLTRLVFDSNPINLRDPHSESVSTIKELLKSQTDSPFTLTALVKDANEAQTLADQIKQLPSVHDTIQISNLVPDLQDDKLVLIEDLDLILGHQLERFSEQIPDGDPKQALVEFNNHIQHILKQSDFNANRDILTTLQLNIQRFLDTQHEDMAYQQLQNNILVLLPYTMNRLRTSLTASPFTLQDIPDYIMDDWISPNGYYKILIMPEYDQNIPSNLKEFVMSVVDTTPIVSGLPVADQASGIAVVNAFIQAFSGAILAIFILLLIILKNIKHSLLVIGPLLLAGLFTGATNVLLNNPFNFANIIALPLLMGMGVDSSIHIMHRLRSGRSCNREILQSSTARGVFFSSITTMCSFTSLAFTSHVGTASMGLLLAVGIFFTLVCTLIVLPAYYGNKS